jgi:hypothetical protein
LPFFGSSLENLLAKIPVMEDQTGNKFQIEIKVHDFSRVHILINLIDKSNNLISLQKLEKLQLKYFIQEYSKFIESGSYDKSESIIGRIQSAIQTAGALIKNRQISKFYLSLNCSLPWTFLDEFYTIDMYDNRCIVKTITDRGTMINVMDRNSDRLVTFFHTLSLKMIYNLYLNENIRQIRIFEKMTKYLRFIIPTIVSIIFINDPMKILSDPFNSSQFYFYIIILGISFFPNIIFKIIINIFIRRGIWKSSVEKKINSIKNALGSLKNK